MPALNPNWLAAYEKALEQLKCRMLSTLDGEKFTFDDYYEIFVPADLRDVFKHVRDKADTGCYPNNTFGYTLKGGYRFNVHLLPQRHAPFIYNAKNVAPFWDVNSSTAQRITSWVTRRVQIGQDFGRALCVLRLLVGQCQSLSQVRFFFPQIAALARMADHTEGLDRMSTAFRETPALTVGLRRACRDVSAVLAASQLLSDPEGDGPVDTPRMEFHLVPFDVPELGLGHYKVT